MRCRFLLALAGWLLCSLPAVAHESRPALLQLTETQPGRYEVLWKRPQRGDLTLGLRISWPGNCRDLAPASAQTVAGAMIERRLLECGQAALIGQRIGIDGLAGTSRDVLVRIEWRDGRVQTNLLNPASPWVDVQGPRPALAVAAEYFVIGVEHILLGIDHLLFVLGLVLMVRGTGLLVKTITAFTLAHSITLAMAVLGLVHAPQAPVEAVIALSILFLASELMRRRRDGPGLTERHPWLVAFSFGLLHGLGFAGALAEVGLPEADIPLALLVFNLGVEAGQLLFVAALLALSWLWRRAIVQPPPPWLRDAPAYAIGSLATFWLIERVAAFG
ncbi:MAG TPA: HupE/UreJ family protein [Arenibaculum sp.]|nr:HupE/UreJ family protein [Arenibaculum sp.]